jgi:hypothetical protein
MRGNSLRAPAAAKRGEQHQRGRFRTLCHMRDAEHAATRMGDDDRPGEAAVRHPARRVVIVGNAFARELQRAAFGSAGIADAQDVVAAPVEREAREAKFREHGGPQRGAPT